MVETGCWFAGLLFGDNREVRSLNYRSGCCSYGNQGCGGLSGRRPAAPCEQAQADDADCKQNDHLQAAALPEPKEA